LAVLMRLSCSEARSRATLLPAPAKDQWHQYGCENCQFTPSALMSKYELERYLTP
jgi:hypothetical protein